MKTLAEIEEAVSELPPEEFSVLLRRMREREAETWDRVFEEDAKAGRLDFLSEEIEGEIARG